MGGSTADRGEQVTDRQPFDIGPYVKTIGKGPYAQQYVSALGRILHFRHDHPDGSILTEMVHFDGVRVIMRATVTKTDGTAVSNYASRTMDPEEHRNDKSPLWRHGVEIAATTAIARALALLGYGSLDDEDDDPPDAPLPVRQPASYQTAPQAQQQPVRAYAASDTRTTVPTAQQAPVQPQADSPAEQMQRVKSRYAELALEALKYNVTVPEIAHLDYNGVVVAGKHLRQLINEAQKGSWEVDE